MAVSELQGVYYTPRVLIAQEADQAQKEHSASFTSPSSSSKSTAPLPYAEENGKFAPFVALDCRGLEFTTFHFRGKPCLTSPDVS